MRIAYSKKVNLLTVRPEPTATVIVLDETQSSVIESYTTPRGHVTLVPFTRHDGRDLFGYADKQARFLASVLHKANKLNKNLIIHSNNEISNSHILATALFFHRKGVNGLYKITDGVWSPATPYVGDFPLSKTIPTILKELAILDEKDAMSEKKEEAHV